MKRFLMGLLIVSIALAITVDLETEGKCQLIFENNVSLCGDHCYGLSV